MELPEDIVLLIKEYSMPLTWPDWRTLHRFTLEDYIVTYKNKIISREKLTYEKFISSNRVYTLSRYYRLFGWNFWLKMPSTLEFLTRSLAKGD